MVGERLRHFAVSAGVAAVLVFTPSAPLYAQTTEHDRLILLLEQIAALTEIVIQLQAQLTLLQSGAATEVATETETESMVTLPVRVHLVYSPHDGVRTHTQPDRVRAIFKERVNERYWKQAGVSWDVKEILTRPILNGADARFTEARHADDRNAANVALLEMISGVVLGQEFNVFVINDFGALEGNGVYFGNTGVAVVAETNGREGGEDFLAYMLAHELGHGLGLGHEEDVNNVMHSGGRSGVARRDRTVLTAEQISTAYEHAANVGTPAVRNP